MKKNKIKRYGKFTIFYQFTSFRECFWYFASHGFKLGLENINIKRQWKFFWQRWNRGWDDSETWNLDKEIAEFIYPRLKRYFEVTITAAPYRTILSKKGKIKEQYQLSEEEWKVIQKKILRAMNLSRLNYKKFHLTVEEGKEVEEGWNLFHEFRRSFWW